MSGIISLYGRGVKLGILQSVIFFEELLLGFRMGFVERDTLDRADQGALRFIEVADAFRATGGVYFINDLAP
jgi:hypothetical protein